MRFKSLFNYLSQIAYFHWLKFRYLLCSCSDFHRVFAATWNVAGKTPDRGLNLNDFLPSDDYSDIYVLGYAQNYKHQRIALLLLSYQIEISYFQCLYTMHILNHHSLLHVFF